MSASIWKGLFKYGLGLAILAYLVVRYWEPADGTGPGLAEMFRKPVQVVPLLLSLAFLTGSVLLTFVRWWMLVRAQGLSFPLSEALRLGAIGYFFNNVLPSSVGGDVIKAVGIAREQDRRTVATATVFFDRAVGLWGLVWLVMLLGGVFWLAGDGRLLDNPMLLGLVRSAGWTVAVTLSGWLLLGLLSERQAHRLAGRLGLVPKIGHALAECWRAVWLYRRRPRSVALALLLTLFSHGGCVLSFHFASRVFATAEETAQLPALIEHGLIVPVGMAIQALPLTPGGVGVGEAGYAWLYTVLGREQRYGLWASFTQRALTWVLGTAGYLLCLGRKRARPANALEPVATGVIESSS